ncbi:site-specific DNA-methyltransferase [Candidatus Dojkabacteria bacterium]|nr:site-specific DNA-methyltransferase [Candidatus Dojkabacteria bacterium]
MENTFKNNLYSLLKKDARLWDDKTKILNETLLKDLIDKLDEKLIGLLFDDKAMREKFFVKIKDVFVLKQSNLKFFIDENKLDNSYTQYQNIIGLRIGNKLLSERDEVVLDWPFKDCVLEGGMIKEDQKRNEIFFNEILAKDEIDRLFDPKVLVNWKRYKGKGDEKVKNVKKDKDGNIRENLIIKGNNLLALHSLKAHFAGKVKLIYIDPPYNPPGPNNTFSYNNNFNHSTWLTFMKNRLEIAKDLLTDDGAMIIAIDENEQARLGVLLDEVFPEYENHCITIVHNPRGVQGTNFSYTHEFAYFIFPRGKKIIKNRKINEEEIGFSNLRNWGGESLRTDAKNCFYPILVDKCTKQIIEFGEVCPDDYHPTINVYDGDFVYIYPIDSKGVERKWRYARQSVEDIQELLRVTEKDGVYDIQIGKDFGQYRTVWIDNRYDSNKYGTQLVKDLVPNSNFSFPKSLYNVYDAIYAVISDDKDAIVLDYHAGSGTTGHAVLDLNKDGGNRKFILVEQMDYVDSITVPRIQEVIKRNKSTANFIYFSLAKWNATAKETILKAKSLEQLEKIFSEIYERYFLNYNVKIKDFKEKIIKEQEFRKLSLEKQKKIFVEMLDANQMYVNFSERADKKYGLSKEDIALSEEFYNLKK